MGWTDYPLSVRQGSVAMQPAHAADEEKIVARHTTPEELRASERSVLRSNRNPGSRRSHFNNIAIQVHRPSARAIGSFRSRPVGCRTSLPEVQYCDRKRDSSIGTVHSPLALSNDRAWHTLHLQRSASLASAVPRLPLPLLAAVE